MSDKTTLPAADEPQDYRDPQRIVVAPAWTDQKTGQVYVHQSLVPRVPDWAHEEHIAPMRLTERFGDVESFARYVSIFASDGTLLLTWNSQGLKAVLDYPEHTEAPGRCQWLALQPFRLSPEWQAWAAFANGSAVTQRQAVERLEDLADDVTAPAPADMLKLLRDLRAGASSQAETTLNPNGTSSVSFKRDTTVSSTKGADLPALLTISIPVLAGDDTHVEMQVRMRVSVDDQAHLLLRFSLPNTQRMLDAVYAVRVAAAQVLLGEERTILRADG